MPAARRDCGGVRILEFNVGDAVVAKDVTKARGKVLEVRRYAESHDAIRIKFEDGSTWWQDGYWYRKA